MKKRPPTQEQPTYILRNIFHEMLAAVEEMAARRRGEDFAHTLSSYACHEPHIYEEKKKHE